VSTLSELRARLREMPALPKITEEEKLDPLLRKGFIWGSRVECEEAIQIAEEEEG
jgi:hypothetical protein